MRADAVMQLIGGRWPKSWQPRGWSTLQHEPFPAWWERCSKFFPQLDPRVLEQWVHRHWQYSDYFGFPLNKCHCEVEQISTADYLARVGTVFHRRPNERLDLDYIFETFNRSYGVTKEPTRTMNASGTWDIPVLLVRSASGFRWEESVFPNFDYWLLEGHQRYKYLLALAERGRCRDHHEALVLTYDELLKVPKPK